MMAPLFCLPVNNKQKHQHSNAKASFVEEAMAGTNTLSAVTDLSHTEIVYIMRSATVFLTVLLLFLFLPAFPDQL